MSLKVGDKMATMREEIYEKLHSILDYLVDIACEHIEKLEVNEEEISIDNAISVLDKLKSTHPEQKIIVETPQGTVELKIGDALIYEGICGEIIIDSE